MGRHKQRYSDGSIPLFAPVAPTVGGFPSRAEPPAGISAGELEEILHKKDLSREEVMVIRQSMVQVCWGPSLCYVQYHGYRSATTHRQLVGVECGSGV